MQFFHKNKFLKFLAKGLGIIIAFILIGILPVTKDLSDLLRILISGGVAAGILELGKGIYHLLFQKHHKIRATTGETRPGRYEGLWIQKRQRVVGEGEEKGITEEKYAILNITYDPTRDSKYILRGIAFEQNLKKVSCIFLAELDVFGADNIKFEAKIRYKDKKKHGGKSKTMAMFKFFRDVSEAYKFENWLFTDFTGKMYDSHKVGYQDLMGHRLNKTYENNYDFEIPDDFSFNSLFKTLETDIPGNF